MSAVGPLARLTVEKFVLSVGDRTSAPGGGSVAALLASLVLHYFIDCNLLRCVGGQVNNTIQIDAGLRLVDDGRPNDFRQTPI